MVFASIAIVLFVVCVAFVSYAVLCVGSKEPKAKKYMGKVRLKKKHNVR